MSDAPPTQPQVKEPERFVGHKVRLSVFEGPLDLLLYLIRAHKYDIVNIPIRDITGQFVEYLALMGEVEADYVGDFLVTAATLMQIKARMLLPKNQSANEDAFDAEKGDDPRVELVERLLEYQRIQEAADTLKMRRDERADLFARSPDAWKNGLLDSALDAQLSESLLLAEVSSFDLLRALQRVLKRVEAAPVALVKREPFSLPERLKDLQARLAREFNLTFETLCDDCQSRLEVVVTFLAVLELIRRGRVKVRQPLPFEEIWVEAA